MGKRWKKVNKIPWYGYFVAGGLVGAVAFCTIYGVRVLNITYCDWLLAQADSSQSLIGLMAYRNSDWQFPIFGLMDTLAYPESVSVLFVDCIPLLAVLTKLLSPVLPATFQYFGLWGLFCLVMQGGITAVIVKKMTSNLAICLTAAAFASTATAVIWRLFFHTALGSQWLILLAIGCWVYREHFETFGRRLALCASMMALAVFIHMYFVVMVFGLMAGMLLNHAIENRRYGQNLVVLSAGAAVGLFALFLLGGFYGGVSQLAGGLGVYSANLNSLFNPMSGSVYTQTLPMGVGQYESVSYLGLGILVLLFPAAVWVIVYLGRAVAKRKLMQVLRSHLRIVLMALVGLVFFVLALSPVVTWNSRTLFTVPLPELLTGLLGIFRASGRFLWPVVYLVMLGVVYLWVRCNNSKVALVALVLALALQWADARTLNSGRSAMYKPKHSFENHLQLPAEAGGYTKLFLMDREILGSYGLETPLYQLGYYAAQNRLRLNDFYFGRSYEEVIEAQRVVLWQELAQGAPQQDAIYVFSQKDALPDVPLHFYDGGHGLWIGLLSPDNSLVSVQAQD